MEGGDNMLTPKKHGEFDKKNWKDLDRLLQSNVDAEKFSDPSLTIRHSDFEMSKDEIIQAAKDASYTVEERDEFLIFS